MKVLGEIREQVSPDSMGKFMEFVIRSAKDLGYSDDRLNEMEHAFREVLTNIVTYAYRETSGDVQITYTVDRADRLVFKIIDWGTSFNMLLASDPLMREEYAEQGIPQPSTRLIKRYTDTVEYQRLENMNYLLATFSPAVRGNR